MNVELTNVVNTVNQGITKTQGKSEVQGGARTERKPTVNIKPKSKVTSESDEVLENTLLNTNESKDIQEEKKIKNTISEINNKIKLSKSQAEFTYHKEVNMISIKVIDSETKEVIREIPPEDTIKMIEKMWKVAGLLLDEKL